jgi:hypothetical protein
MHIDWWTLGLQAVNALVLVWLLSRFLFRPVADILAARQKAAEQAIADTQAAKAAAEGARAKAEAEAAGLAQRRREALKAVEAEAANEKAALLAEARAEAESSTSSRRPRLPPNARRRRLPRPIGRGSSRSISPPNCSIGCREGRASTASSKGSRRGCQHCRTPPERPWLRLTRRSISLRPKH